MKLHHFDNTGERCLSVASFRLWQQQQRIRITFGILKCPIFCRKQFENVIKYDRRIVSGQVVMKKKRSNPEERVSLGDRTSRRTFV
jgi:hypothetical protein